MKLGRFLAGIASGLTFGVLFAPKEGKKLRKELTKGKGDIKALGTAFKDAGVDAFEEIKKLSKHEQVEAFLQMSEEKVKEIAANLDENNSEMVQKAKVKLEEISAFALKKATDLKNMLNQEDEFVSKTIKKKPTVKKKAPTKKTNSATPKTTPKKKAVSPKKPSPASKKTK